MPDPTRPATIHMPAAETLRGGASVQTLTIIFDAPLPPMYPASGASELAGMRDYYAEQAELMLEHLLRHAPGGLVTQLFAAMASHYATLFRVPEVDDTPRPRQTLDSGGPKYNADLLSQNEAGECDWCGGQDRLTGVQYDASANVYAQYLCQACILKRDAAAPEAGEDG